MVWKEKPDVELCSNSEGDDSVLLLCFIYFNLNQWKQPESQTQSSDRDRDQSWTSLSFGSEMSLSEVEMIK